MLSSLAKNISSPKRETLVLTSTRLKENFEKNKNNLKIFQDLNEGEKLGKMINKEGDCVYYKVGYYFGIQFVRWWNNEGRLKTIEYLEEDFSLLMKFLDELLNNLEVDPFCQYASMAKEVRDFIDSILPGLYSLKKTYPDTIKMIAKVDSIILTLIDFKDKTEDYIRQKNKGIKLLIKRTANEI